MLVAVALAGSSIAAAAAPPRPTAVRQDGGTFRVVVLASDFDSLDPALSYSNESGSLVDVTCARLMTHPDRPLPEGLTLVPEVAAAAPTSTPDRRAWTFRLRRGFRFSDGTAVRATAFARAIARTLAPGVASPGAQFTEDIVGAAAYRAGRTSRLAGVTAAGMTLVVRFRHPVPDFPARTTMTFFCAVPPNLPSDPEGVAVFPSAGPYFVAEYRPGERAVLERNPFYGGDRPAHVNRFVVDLQPTSHAEILRRVERGEADWGPAGPAYYDAVDRLARRYGVNRSRFFVEPGLTLRGLALNTSRPLFRNNPKLRRAVNFALDRAAIRRVAGDPLVSSLTDQYLPPGLPGFTDARIYPLQGPDLRRARSLARGNTRGGQAVLYTFDVPATRAQAQVVKRNLAQIGIAVEVDAIPGPAYFSRVTAPHAPYDLAAFGWAADYPDPYTFINQELDGQFGPETNPARFDSPAYNRLMRAAALTQGAARLEAYGRLDVRLARDAAPIAAVDNQNVMVLVSSRVGCVVLRPMLDLAAVCVE